MTRATKRLAAPAAIAIVLLTGRLAAGQPAPASQGAPAPASQRAPQAAPGAVDRGPKPAAAAPKVPQAAPQAATVVPRFEAAAGLSLTWLIPGLTVSWAYRPRPWFAVVAEGWSGWVPGQPREGYCYGLTHGVRLALPAAVSPFVQVSFAVVWSHWWLTETNLHPSSFYLGAAVALGLDLRLSPLVALRLFYAELMVLWDTGDGDFTYEIGGGKGLAPRFGSALVFRFGGPSR